MFHGQEELNSLFNLGLSLKLKNLKKKKPHKKDRQVRPSCDLFYLGNTCWKLPYRASGDIDRTELVGVGQNHGSVTVGDEAQVNFGVVNTGVLQRETEVLVALKTLTEINVLVVSARFD